MLKKKISMLLFLSAPLLIPFFLSNKVSASSPLIVRLSGENRYETNISIIKKGWSEAANVVLANGENYPDALCAAPLAKAKNAPILLTKTDQLNDLSISELSRLKTKNVYIIGGTGVISNEVEDQLKNLGISCIRLAGINRYETSVKIAEQIGTDNGIVVASGENFPDALSIAPIAAEKGMPILLSSRNALPKEVSSYLQDKNIPNSYVIGGTAVLSSDIKTSLKNAKRLSGMNRYETNINIIKEFENSLDFNSIYAASAQNFPDALSGSVLSANANAPIVLMDNDLSEVTSDFLKDQNSKTINILGGTGAISSNTENILKNTVKSLNITKVDTVFDLAFIGEDYHFPPTALVTYEDSSTKLVPVKWNGNTVDTSKAGSYNFEGTVSGYTGKVQMNLKVTEETGNINGNLVNGSYFAYYKDSLYYVNVKDNNSIYRLNNSDSKITKLNSDSSAYLNIVGDHIYYSTISDYGKIYKMNLDGSEKTKIIDYSTSYFVVIGDWIYYSYKDKGIPAFYKMKTDGSNNTKISDDEAVYINVVDNYIYYSNRSDNNSIYKMKIDGSERSKISTDDSGSLNIADNCIYYLATDGTSDQNGPQYKLYKINTDGTGKTKISDDCASNLNVYGDWIYFTNRSNGDKLYKIQKDGTNKTVLVNDRAAQINIIGDIIFYYNLNYNNTYFVMKLDGTSYGRFGIPTVNEKESNNTFAFANEINPAQGYGDATSIVGSIKGNDIDCFKVKTAFFNFPYSLNVIFAAPNIGSNAVIHLIDQDGNDIYSVQASYKGIASFSLSLPSLPEERTFYLKVFSPKGELIETGEYNLMTYYELSID